MIVLSAHAFAERLHDRSRRRAAKWADAHSRGALGFVIVCAIIVHIYAAIWVKGSIKAMAQGTVSYGWARRHHSAWYSEVVGRERALSRQGAASGDRGAPRV